MNAATMNKPEAKHYSDAQLLEWIEDGTIYVDDIHSDRPTLWFNGRRKKAELIAQGGRRYTGGQQPQFRWRWHIVYKGLRRKVYCGRLVWMFVHRKLVPDGCQIDHDNDNKFDDSIDNLKCLTHAEHGEKHHGRYYEDLPE